MLPICNSPNADTSKLRLNVAVKDDVDFLLLSSTKERTEALFAQGICVFWVAEVSQMTVKKFVIPVISGLKRRLSSTSQHSRGGANCMTWKKHPLCYCDSRVE